MYPSVRKESQFRLPDAGDDFSGLEFTIVSSEIQQGTGASFKF